MLTIASTRRQANSIKRVTTVSGMAWQNSRAHAESVMTKSVLFADSVIYRRSFLMGLVTRHRQRTVAGGGVDLGGALDPPSLPALVPDSHWRRDISGVANGDALLLLKAQQSQL